MFLAINAYFLYTRNSVRITLYPFILSESKTFSKNMHVVRYPIQNVGFYGHFIQYGSHNCPLEANFLSFVSTCVCLVSECVSQSSLNYPVGKIFSPVYSPALKCQLHLYSEDFSDIIVHIIRKSSTLFKQERCSCKLHLFIFFFVSCD